MPVPGAEAATARYKQGSTHHYVAGGDGGTSESCCSPLLKRNDLIIGLVVALTAFLVYANSIGNGFAWDDSNIIVSNRLLNGSPLDLFGGIDTARIEATPFYRPGTMLSFWFEGRLHGRNPFLMHFFNVLLHSLNAFFVYRLARALLDNSRAAMLAGLLFAVHPINAEGVNFLSGGRNTLLACSCALLAYLLHCKSMREKKTLLSVAGSVVFLAGLFSKESALGILPLIIALEFTHPGSEGRDKRITAVVRLIPYAVCTICYLILRTIALSGAGVQMEILAGLGSRILNNIYIIPRYLLSVAWPQSISNWYLLPEDFHLLALPLAAAWLFIILVLAWLLTKGRSRATLFGLCWLFVFLLPVIGIIPFPSAPLADRFFYTPGIGLWIILADQSSAFFDRTSSINRFGVGLSLVVLAVLASFTVARNLDWKDDFSLFSQYVRQYPDVAWGHHNLGCAYLDKARNLELAERSFKRALELDPKFPRLQTQMGYLYLLRGDFAMALSYYNEAIYQNPVDSEALLNRGTVLDQLGSYSEALESYRRFLDLSAEHNELPWERPRVEERVRELGSRVKGLADGIRTE